MATLLRISRQGRVVLTRLGNCQGPQCLVRSVSTTKRGSDLTHVSVETSIDKSQELKVLEEHFADADPNKLKNWISEGFHMTDRDADRFNSNIGWFSLVSIVFVGLHFIFYYMPDHQNSIHYESFVMRTVQMCLGDHLVMSILESTVVPWLVSTDILVFRMRDWSTREAYLDIDRREKAGLPLIDPYLIPPEQVVLPTDEEIGDERIII